MDSDGSAMLERPIGGRDPQRVTVRAFEGRRFVALGLKSWNYRVDDEARGQATRTADHRAPIRQPPMRRHSTGILGATLRVNRAIDTLSPEQVGMCRVDNCVDMLMSDISLDELEARMTDIDSFMTGVRCTHMPPER